MPAGMTMPNAGQEALLLKAQQVWNMLDDMAVNNPESYKKFIDKQMKEASQDLRDRNPSAELCVRTWLRRENCYLFVEIFSWKLISAPRVLQNETQELPAHITDVEYQTNKTDGKKNARIMFVVNPEVIEKLNLSNKKKQPPEENFLMQNILELIRKQTGLSLNTVSFEFLEKSLCIGDPVDLRKKIFNVSKQKDTPLTNKQESVLEKLTNIKLSDENEEESANVKLGDKTKTQEEEEANNPLIEEIPKPSLIEPKYELDKSDEDCFTINVELPGVNSGEECDVDLIEDVLTVEAGNKYSLILPLNAKIDDANASADFKTKTAILTIKIPILKEN